MKDLIIAQATNFTWEQIEPFAVSTVWCGFKGDRVLIVENLAQDVRDTLKDLGFILLEMPQDIPGRRHKYFAYMSRFLVVFRYLQEHAGEYRFVFSADTRDLIFQGNPVTWMEKNLGDKKLVAASEFCKHRDSPPCMHWVDGMYPEVRDWMMETDIYCSGFIAGYAEYMKDLCLATYLYSRDFIGEIWGPDQPVYNTLMHQKAYADITHVQKADEYFCINCVNIAFDNLSKHMTDFPPIRPYYDYNPHHTTTRGLLWNGGIPNLSEYCVLHQYDRIPDLADNIRRVFTLENLRSGRRPFRLELTNFPQISE